MTNIEINLKVELTEQFLKDIMCTMIESGFDSIYYWGSTDSVVRDEETKDVLSFHVREDEPSKYLGVVAITMNAQVLARTIERALTTPQPLFFGEDITGYLHRAVMEQDAGDVDALVADALVQVALFNEVVYG